MAVLGALLLLSHLYPAQGSCTSHSPCSGTGESSRRCLCPGEPDPFGGCSTGTSPVWLQSLSPAPRSRWCPEPGLQSGTVFPFPLPEQRPGLSKEEGKEALLTLAWERGAPGRAQEAAELTPRSPPCTLPYLPQQEPGSALAGCSPASPPLLSAVLGWGLSPPSWGQGGLCPTAQPPLRRHGPACGSDWDRTAAWWSFTTQTQRFLLPFLCFRLVPRVFIREQQRVKKVVAVVSVSFSPLLFTLFAQDTR